MMIQSTRLFDRVVPDPLKFSVKEMYYIQAYYRSNLFRERETFAQVEVETNSGCDRACEICPRSVARRERGDMRLEVFELLLDQLLWMGFSGTFSPVAYNEPFLDPRLSDLMREVRRRLPRVNINIYTNGSSLTLEKIREIFDAGINGLMITQYHGNLPQDGGVVDILNGLPRDLRRKIRYRVLYDDSPLFNRGGLVEVENPVRKRVCYKASVDAIVDSEGNLVLCANDYYAKYIYGNIQEKYILDLWNEPSFREVRRQLRRGNFSESPPICQYCTEIIPVEYPIAT
jgi:radical SAM protein with 4Fe4S-binding SPASM domain